MWGATRAYRWACLQDVLPLEERHGWDGIDQLKARARGWQHENARRPPVSPPPHGGTRGRIELGALVVNGDTAYFMGYRPWYLVARTCTTSAGIPAPSG